ncbi:hypothetical protein [Variovorax saccharolyticus]|nr:hypothetical protein [Variovorax sp. J22R187]MDM0020162.1 hypothetical protein [Variovorax sp. J22R187]
MPPVLTDDFQAPRPLRQALADLAISLLVVAALALVTGLLATPFAPL